jgi:uncharacterized protein YbcI
MNIRKWSEKDANIIEQLSHAASRLQQLRTGHAPTGVTVVLQEDTLVVTLRDALTPAEKALSQTSDGAAKVQEFHRQLFANSTDEMRDEIKRITGRQVREASAEIETASGTVVHAFTTGTMVQVFLLTPDEIPAVIAADDRLKRAEDEGLQIPPL